MFSGFSRMCTFFSRAKGDSPTPPLLLRPIINILALLFNVDSAIHEDRIKFLQQEIQNWKTKCFALQEGNAQERIIYQNTLEDIGEFISYYTSEVQKIHSRTAHLAFENAVLQSDNQQLEKELGKLQTAYNEITERTEVISKVHEEREKSLMSKIKDLDEDLRRKEEDVFALTSQRNSATVAYATLRLDHYALLEQNEGLKALLSSSSVGSEEGIMSQTSL